MHLDIDLVDIETEARRLEALGAQRVAGEPMHEHGTNWIRATGRRCRGRCCSRVA
ncbi:MAG: hypothetical protein JNK12_20080 [Acidimicrobiales bacterium]|nr:hypothetical protein [Acidimicrobiales bacterium]